MSDQPVVRTKNLSKHYGDIIALENLSIELERGRILGFIGPNGAGKTTTINILVGLARPTAGEAFISGCDCTRDVKRIQQLVGFMPDTFGTYDNMRVTEYLDFFGAAFKIPRQKRRERIDWALDLANATWMRDRYVDALSHGMKQRVGIARTMLHDPDVLILDEPANGLDPNARIEMRQTLLRLSEMGKTLIVTSHILPELSRICDTVAIITDGILRAFGTLDQILNQVRQRRIIVVQLANPQQVDAASGFLREQLDDTDEVTPSTTEAEVRFTTSRGEQALAELLKALLAQDLVVCQYHEVPLDLEDAFMSVTAATEDQQSSKVTESLAAATQES